MGNRALTYATWAYLGEDDVPVLCTRKKANEWAWSKEGLQRSQIKHDRILGWTIRTSFERYSLAQDGPPLFWNVSCFKERGAMTGFRSQRILLALVEHRSRFAGRWCRIQPQRRLFRRNSGFARRSGRRLARIPIPQ